MPDLYQFLNAGNFMTSFTAAAKGRLGFRIVHAGSREVMRSIINRSKLWLLVRLMPVMMLAAMASAPQARKRRNRHRLRRQHQHK